MPAFILRLCGQSSSALEFIRGPEHLRPRLDPDTQLDPGESDQGAAVILCFAKALLVLLQSGEHDEHPKNSYRG